MIEFISKNKTRRAEVFDTSNWGCFVVLFRHMRENDYKAVIQEYEKEDEAIAAAKGFVEES